MKETPLSLAEFEKSIAAAKRQFLSIRKKYPELRAHLLLSLKGAQTPVDSPLRTMLLEFSALLEDGSVKNKILKFLKKPQPDKPTGFEKQAWERRFQKLAAELEFKGEIRTEIRFSNLDYDLLARPRPMSWWIDLSRLRAKLRSRSWWERFRACMIRSNQNFTGHSFSTPLGL